MLSQRSGGLYIGVGTDQNLLMAGWSKPDRVAIVDIDQWVIDLHWLYNLIFIDARTPREFMAFWRPKNKKRSIAHIRSVMTDRSRLRGMLLMFKNSRRRIRLRFINQIRLYRRLEIPWFLNDIDQYNYVRNLFLKGRWTANRANLAGAETMQAIARAAKESGLKVRTLYLSNVEDYLKYRPQYRSNILALPTDNKSIVLRTSVRKIVEKYYWSYSTQSVDDYKVWLGQKKIERVYDILGKAIYTREKLVRFKKLPRRR